ncbi:MAG: T9SS type A sorting domain-containing protein [Candidatus Hydrothermia bacterium]
MKRFFVIIIMAAFVIPLWGQSAVNLLRNPGFEVWDTSSTGQDSIPSYWHFFTRSVLCSGYVSKTMGYEGYGAGLVVIGDTSGYDASFYHYVNRIDTLPFANDTFLLYIRVKENSANIGGRFYCYWQDSAGVNVGAAVSSSYTSNSPDWQELYVTTARPGPNAVTFKFDFRIYKYATSEDSIIVDDAYFGPLLVGIAEKTLLNASIPSIVDNVLRMEFSALNNMPLEVSIFSADGRKLNTLYSGSIAGTMVLSKDMSLYRKGVYFVVVNSGGMSRQYRVIKL